MAMIKVACTFSITSLKLWSAILKIRLIAFEAWAVSFPVRALNTGHIG